MSYGLLLLQEEESKAATAALSHAVAISEPSEKFDMLLACSCCKFRSNDRQGALDDLLDAGNLHQLDVESLIKLAELHFGYKDVAKATTILDRAALLEPLDAKTTEKRAAWKYDIDDYSGAIADLDTVILLGTGNSLVYRNRGIAKVQLGHFEAALADLHQATAKETDSEDRQRTLLGKAAAKRSMGNLEGALVDWDTADQIQPLSDHEQARRQECVQQLADSRGVVEQTIGTDAMDDHSTADSLDYKA